MATENLHSPYEGHTKLHTDRDGDYLSLENSGGTNYLTLHASTTDQCVRVEDSEIPELLCRIAEAAGVEVLVLPKPRTPTFTLGRPDVSVAATDPHLIQIDQGLNFALRVSTGSALDLIWRIAEQIAKSSSEPRLADVSALVADLRQAGLLVNSSTSAKKLLQSGYRKDASRVAKSGPLCHTFNALPEVAGERS